MFEHPKVLAALILFVLVIILSIDVILSMFNIFWITGISVIILIALAVAMFLVLFFA